MFDWNVFQASAVRADIFRGDSIELLQKLPEGSIDSFVTDPPYGIQLALGTRPRGNLRSIAGDGKVQARRLWRAWVPLAARAAKPDTSHIIFGTWKSPWMHQVLSRHFQVKGCIVWNKRIIGLGHYLRPQWELAYFVTKGKPARHGGSAPGDVWEQARLTRTQHPCEKPIDLLRRAIRLTSKPGQLICDPFAGIASTVVAAIAEERECLGFEIAPKFVTLGQSRIRNALLERNIHASHQ